MWMKQRCLEWMKYRKDEKMYKISGRVRYSEIDHKGTLGIPAMINYFQDTTTFQSEDIGLGVEAMKAQNRAWILSYWQIEMKKDLPGLGDPITTGTYSSGTEKFFGYRDFVLLDGQEDLIARAHSVWINMDLAKGRPLRIKPEDMEGYDIGEPFPDMDTSSRKISMPEVCEEREPIRVMRSHIDTNEHVNNCQYVQMALEVLPEDLDVQQIRVEYRKSAVLGDVIYPKVAVEEGRTVALLCEEDGNPYVLVELS